MNPALAPSPVTITRLTRMGARPGPGLSAKAMVAAMRAYLQRHGPSTIAELYDLCGPAAVGRYALEINMDNWMAVIWGQASETWYDAMQALRPETLPQIVEVEDFRAVGVTMSLPVLDEATFKALPEPEPGVELPRFWLPIAVYLK